MSTPLPPLVAEEAAALARVLPRLRELQGAKGAREAELTSRAMRQRPLGSVITIVPAHTSQSQSKLRRDFQPMMASTWRPSITCLGYFRTLMSGE